MKNKSPRKIVLIVSLVLIIALAASATLAYMVNSSGSVVNRFTPSSVQCLVVEGEGAISVRNTGDIPAYIRASYVLNWMDASGNVSGVKPNAGVSVASNWTNVGGIWYYGAEVPVGGEIAFVSFTPASNGDYHLAVEVVAEAIQSEGMGSDVANAIDAWAAAKTRPVK